MIKVLHFVSTPAIWSGVMSVIMNYYRHIDRSRVQFDFLCFLPCEESYEKEINELGGQVFFISKPSASPRTLKELMAFFKKHQGEYQWLHNHEVYLSFLLKPISEHYGIKDFIVHSHATRYSDRKWAAVRNRILCFPIRFMKCHRFACSKAAGAFLFGKRLVEKGNVYILYNAIDTEKFRYNPQKRKEIRDSLGIENKAFVIGHVGRFVPQKNQKFLFDVFKEISSQYPQAHLLLIGDGPLKKKMEIDYKDLCSKHKIHFLGRQPDISNFLSAMDVFVLPSIFEGIGIALIEAQANGLWGIASNYVPEEGNITGKITFLPLDISTWILALKQYIASENLDRDMKASEAFGARHYEIQVEADVLEKFYENTNINVHL